MKTVVSLLILLFSMQATADCTRMKDGTCYNDDYIGEERLPTPRPLPIPEPPHPPMGIAVGEPNPSAPRFPHKKKRHCLGDVGTFREIGCSKDGPIPIDGPGSK
jgi:hypothetical protein